MLVTNTRYVYLYRMKSIPVRRLRRQFSFTEALFKSSRRPIWVNLWRARKTWGGGCIFNWSPYIHTTTGSSSLVGSCGAACCLLSEDTPGLRDFVTPSFALQFQSPMNLGKARSFNNQEGKLPMHQPHNYIQMTDSLMNTLSRLVASHNLCQHANINTSPSSLFLSLGTSPASYLWRM